MCCASVLVACISRTFQMLLFCIKTFRPAKIHLLSAIRTVNHSRKWVNFSAPLNSAFVLAKLLHQIKIVLRNNRLVRVLKNYPFLFGVLYSLFALVGFGMCAEIHSMPCVFSFFKDMVNGLFSPAMKSCIRMTCISTLGFGVSS